MTLLSSVVYQTNQPLWGELAQCVSYLTRNQNGYGVESKVTSHPCRWRQKYNDLLWLSLAGLITKAQMH